MNTTADQTLYDPTSDTEYLKYADEAKARWGNTNAYKVSQKRVAQMTKAEMELYKQELEQINQDLASHMKDGVESDAVQAVVARHYKWLSHWYEPNLEIYRGLAEMYVNDSRFKENYEKYAVGLAQFMHDAMLVFIKNN